MIRQQTDSPVRDALRLDREAPVETRQEILEGDHSAEFHQLCLAQLCARRSRRSARVPPVMVSSPGDRPSGAEGGRAATVAIANGRLRYLPHPKNFDEKGGRTGPAPRSSVRQFPEWSGIWSAKILGIAR